MNVTFLAHSGFLVELDTQCLLFDWWKGDLPPLPAKPLVCFASHHHPDHFDPRIFALDDGARDIVFVLGKDIRFTPHNRLKWNLREETESKCRRMDGGETLSLPGVDVTALRSTDEGAAFLVRADGTTIYHAGDLNWWHWEGEDPGWNRNMEINFKKYIEPLRDVRIDLAFAPLDPRLEGSYALGFQYLLELADIDRIIPMHQWEDFSPTDRFCAEFPQWADRIVKIHRSGQQFAFNNKEVHFYEN